jgi:hypothetical protein
MIPLFRFFLGQIIRFRCCFNDLRSSLPLKATVVVIVAVLVSNG